MEEKKTSRIICEMLIGIIMTLPFFINEKNRYLDAAWITVLFKALFSVGIPLAVIKLMSIVYRFISIIFIKAMKLDEMENAGKSEIDKLKESNAALRKHRRRNWAMAMSVIPCFRIFAAEYSNTSSVNVSPFRTGVVIRCAYAII